jgi:ABC-type Fe3+-hydroxamate transport system substrate-binding protein
MRIVSLCPSLTELVFDLGRGRDLVAITDYCVHPAAGVQAIEKIGGTKSPDVARIIELDPDLVLLNDEENRLEDARCLESAGVRCHSSMPRTAGETASMVRSIGRVFDCDETGERIAHAIEVRASAARRGATGKRPVRFAYLIWRKPWMSVNADTYAHSLLALAGGINAFGDLEDRYPEVTLEELTASGIELLLLGSEPFPFSERHVDELARETGIDSARIRLADGEYLSWHGSRTPDGIDYAARVIAAVREEITARER